MSDTLLYLPVTGGQWRVHHFHPPTLLPGAQDTFVVDPGPGAHYCVRTANAVGASCVSNEVYIPGTVTAVGGDAHLADPVTSIRIFDVNGRLVVRKRPPASGIYYQVETRRSGHRAVRKVVIVK